MIADIGACAAALYVAVYLPVRPVALRLAPDDILERIALGAALGAVTVPGMASVMMTVSGSGLTSAVALSAPLGIGAAVRWFASRTGLGTVGAASDDDEPDIHLRLAPPLVLVSVMAVIVAVVDDGPHALRRGIAIAALAALAAGAAEAAHRVGWLSRLASTLGSAAREDESAARETVPSAEGEEDDTPRISRALRGLLRGPLADRGHAVAPGTVLRAVGVVLAVARGYTGPAFHEWPSVRGLDQYVHAAITQLTLDTGSGAAFDLYPPGFHTLTALISRLTTLSPTEVYAAVGPSTVLVSALGCYVVARRAFGASYGIAALLIAAAVATTPYRYFNDGGYVSLVAAGLLLPTALSALIRVMRRPSLLHGAVLAILLAGVVYYHTITTVEAALVVGVVVALALPVLLATNRRAAGMVLASIVAAAVVSVAIAWNVYDIPTVLWGAEDGRVVEGARSAIGSQNPLRLTTFWPYTSRPLAYLTGIGLVALLFSVFRLPRGRRIPVLAAVVWLAVLFALSRTSSSGFPLRAARDVAFPMAVLGAVAVVAMVRSARFLGLGTTAAALATAVILMPAAATSLETAFGPSRLAPVTPAWEQAGSWLRDHRQGGTIVTEPYPNHALLAMSGYSGLRASAPAELDDPRSAGIKDRDERLDVAWLYEHPNGARTRSILRRRDVRYLVFLRERPAFVPLRYESPLALPAFANHSGYETVFANQAFVILRPKPSIVRG